MIEKGDAIFEMVYCEINSTISYTYLGVSLQDFYISNIHSPIIRGFTDKNCIKLISLENTIKTYLIQFYVSKLVKSKLNIVCKNGNVTEYLDVTFTLI